MDATDGSDVLVSTDTTALTLTIDEAIDKVGFGTFQRILFWTIGIFSSADAVEILLLSYLSIVLQVDWHLTNTERAFIVSSVFFGSLVGAIVLGKVGDIFGRRVALLTVSSMTVTFGVLTAAAPSYPWLLVARTLVGVGVGAASITYDILAEFVPAEHRASSIMSVFYFWSVGSAYVSACAYLCLGVLSNNWRLLVLMCSLPCWVGLATTIFFIPESPHWLVTTQRKPEKALEILRKIAKQNGLDPTVIFPPGTLIISESSTRVTTKDEEEEEGGGAATASPTEKEHGDDVVPLETTPLNEKPTTSDNEELTGYLWIFSKDWSWIMFNLAIVTFGEGFLYYGVVLVITQIFAHEHNGTFHFNYIAIFLGSSAEIAGLYFTIPLLDRYGRLPPQAWFYILAGVSVAALCFVNSWQNQSNLQAVLLIVLSFLARAFVMGSTSSGCVMTPEILTTNVRATGHGFLNGIGHFGAAASPFILQATTPLPQIAMIVGVAGTILALSVLQLPETNGHTLGRMVVPRSWYHWCLSLLSDCSEKNRQDRG